MQSPAETQTAPVAAVAPASQPVITTVGPNGSVLTLEVPSTVAEVRQLMDQRGSLSEQLISVTSRRSELVAEIRNAPGGVSRRGLEGRVRVLDQRIIQIENDLALTGRQLSAAPRKVVTTAGQEGWKPGDDDWANGLMVGGGVGVTFAIVAAYLLQRFGRRRRPAPPTQITADSHSRLERLERGMEAIAVEIERVSEGQRFVTKLLSESRTPLGAGQTVVRAAALEHEISGPA